MLGMQQPRKQELIFWRASSRCLGVEEAVALSHVSKLTLGNEV